MVYTVQRTNPYSVELTRINTADDKGACLVFGKATNTPFGTVSNNDKHKIGIALKDHMHG